jgi:HB1, ASXL, restriction endonuclease HTH domain
MSDDIRDTILSTIEASLDAQLRAVRRLRKGENPEVKPSRRSRLSQVDMAYDVLKRVGEPLHITDLLDRIHSAFGIRVDRDSLVSSLAKKISHGDRFVRIERNTFALRKEKK